MSKFTHYLSPFKYLSSKLAGLKRLGNLYYKFNQFDNELVKYGEDKYQIAGLFLGGFHPLMAIGKDSALYFKMLDESKAIKRGQKPGIKLQEPKDRKAVIGKFAIN